MSKTFKIMQQTENTLLVVDSLNLAFRYKHSGATDFAEDYLRTVQSLKKSYKASKVIIAGDQGSSQYRKQLYPEYKQNRKDKFAEQTEAEKAAFELFFEDFTKTLDYIQQTTDYPVLRFPGVEADDIAAYIVANKQKLSTDQIWLVSSDKDWDLLIQPNVSRFSYVTRKETTWENWNTHYNFKPEDYISVKCLMGDTGDNVPGVPGIGPKRAEQLVQEWGSTYDIIANLPIQSKYKYVAALNESKEQLLLNYQLMDLVTHCQEALGTENCEKVNNILETYVNE
jgi:DNA polymerase-1